MTFAALFVSEKREKRKLTLNKKSKQKPRQQPKEKIYALSAFSFAKAGAKEKAIKKKTPK